MADKNERYRNPPAPLGYIKPDIVFKERSDEDPLLDDLLTKLIASGIFEEEDVTIYDHFSINPSSEEENDEIIEIPVEPLQKVVEVVVIDDPPVKSVENELADVKQEPPSPKLHTFVERDVERSPSSASPSSEIVKPGKSSKKEKVKSGKKSKKYDQDSKKSYHGKHRKDHREKINDSKKYSSDDDSDYSSDKRKERTKKDKKIIDGDSYRHEKKSKKETQSGSKFSKSKKSPSPCSSKMKDSKKLVSYEESFSSENDDAHSSDKRRERTPQSSESHRSEIKDKKETHSDSHGARSKRPISPCSSKVQDGKSVGHKKMYSDIDIDDSSSGRTKNEFDESVVRNIKPELPGTLLHGVYRCDVCNLTLNSESTFMSHMDGKRHQKAVNAKNIANFDPKACAIPITMNKCPKPMPGYYRTTLNQRAKIQPSLDKTLTTPCPGLENVVEIQGILETSYYCIICNSACNVNSLHSHLSGYKHQLSALKLFRSDLYDRWCYKPKYRIEGDLLRELEIIERMEGRGEVTVEKEFKDSTKPIISAGPSTTEMIPIDMPSTSQHIPDRGFIDDYEQFRIPDPSKPGFYCRLCDSHSNSEAMWQNHVVGKRHLANIRKAPGAAPSKVKYIPAAKNTRPLLFDYLESENPEHLPVVGLRQIREIRKPDINSVTYNCFLCNACVSSIDIVNHVLSRKHREKYLESIKHPELETLRDCHISDTFMESVITDISQRVEAEEGTGAPEVYFDKSAVRRGGGGV